MYFKNGELQKLIKSKSIEDKLKLTSSIQMSNMHVWKNNEIHKYYNPNYMLKDYIEIRLDIYAKRKEHYQKVLENELKLLKYKAYAQGFYKSDFPTKFLSTHKCRCNFKSTNKLQ